ncbi:MAG: hypothetical protein DMF80_02740 [Acidobacteria bacterium]|nr:MAG: hypothetical protein DMF80_02740 [Acidobacteriota bacterium]
MSFCDSSSTTGWLGLIDMTVDSACEALSVSPASKALRASRAAPSTSSSLAWATALICRASGLSARTLRMLSARFTAEA